MNGWKFACPACRAPLPESACCDACGGRWPVSNGIWRCLGPDRQAEHAPFLEDYRALRVKEARGSESPAWYRALPTVPEGDPFAWQWHIRKTTLNAFTARVLAPLAKGLRIADCGAGCGWFSYRMRTLGHLPCSIDINVDDRDGLGAARHFAPDWPVIEADFNALPIHDESADMVVFNGSLHYAADYRATTAEALRILRPRGQIVILDSPLYHRPEAGAAMRAERRAAYEKQYGTPWRATASADYLDRGQLRTLADDLNLDIRVHPVWYGWRWHLTHLRARWLGPREMAEFAIITARRR